MDVIKNLKHHDMALTIVFVVYLVCNIQSPPQVCGIFDNIIGNVAIALTALYLFSISNPIVGVLGLLVAFQFISRCQFSNSPLKQVSNLVSGKGFTSPWKRQPITLEEEMVSKMAPLVVNEVGPQLNYKPIMGDQHGALFVADA